MPGPNPKVTELLATHPKGMGGRTWPQLTAHIVEDARSAYFRAKAMKLEDAFRKFDAIVPDENGCHNY